MASLMSFSTLLILFVNVFFTFWPSSARNIVSPETKSEPTSNGSNYTHVCEQERLAQLGLKMSELGFCDLTLSYEVRAKDLIDRMTLSEKVNQLGDVAKGVSRLGLPPYKWWSEALHGVSDVGRNGTFFDDVVPGATSFPTVILTSAAFNEDLWKNIGKAVSNEARAMYNLGRAGLTFWSPNINVVRDPRWGRTIETPGEDPLVVGTYAKNYVRGLQDVEGTENTKDLNSRPLKVSSCCKHYAAYDVDKWLQVDRFHFDAKVTEQDMIETFLRPFEMCVKEGDVSSVMCSYNRVNGIPTCADPKLLNTTIRGDWNLHGYIVSDCDSLEVMVDSSKWLGDTGEDAAAQAMKAGLDLDCGDYYPRFTENAVKQGKVRVTDIDRSLKYLYVVLMRLGYFDGISQYKSLGKSDICTKQNIELSREAARQGIVLLQNVNQTLPLVSDTSMTLAVVGPHANATEAMIGNYAGVPCKYYSPIDGMKEHRTIKYEMGCDDVACKNESSIFLAIQAAKEADATVIVAGLDLSVEQEALDRVDLVLPGYQTQLITQVAQVAKGPVILVIMSGGGVDITFAKENEKIKAILWAGYPGEQGGHALADVIFGMYNPGGRLPLTWYPTNYTDQLPMTSMQLRPVDSLGYPGRTYKFFNGTTVYPFGFGLSYTAFNYNIISSKTSVDIKLGKFQQCRDIEYTVDAYKTPCQAVLVDDIDCSKYDFKFEIEVQNVGKKDGDEVVIVYSKPPKGIVGANIKQVIGFKRVHVEAGKSKKVKFVFNACKGLGIVDYTAYQLLPSGMHKIVVGDDVASLPFQVNIH